MTGWPHLIAVVLVSQDWASRDVGDLLGGLVDSDCPVDVLWVLDMHQGNVFLVSLAILDVIRYWIPARVYMLIQNIQTCIRRYWLEKLPSNVKHTRTILPAPDCAGFGLHSCVAPQPK